MKIWVVIVIFCLLLILECVLLYLGRKTKNKPIIACGAIVACLDVCFIGCWLIKRYLIDLRLVEQAIAPVQVLAAVLADVFLAITCLSLTGIALLLVMIVSWLSWPKEK